MATMKLQSLGELQQIKKEIAAQAQRKLEEQARLLEAQRQDKKRASQRNLFLAAIGQVQPLPLTARADLRPAPPPAHDYRQEPGERG